MILASELSERRGKDLPREYHPRRSSNRIGFPVTPACRTISTRELRPRVHALRDVIAPRVYESSARASSVGRARFSTLLAPASSRSSAYPRARLRLWVLITGPSLLHLSLLFFFRDSFPTISRSARKIFRNLRAFVPESVTNSTQLDAVRLRWLEEERSVAEPVLEGFGPAESHCGVSATHDPSPTRGRHALQRDAARARGQWEGVRAVGPRGGPAEPRSPSPSGQADRAHRFAQPANSYQRQKYSLAQHAAACRSDDGPLHPASPSYAHPARIVVTMPGVERRTPHVPL